MTEDDDLTARSGRDDDSGEGGVERVVALSDGVFAIAITLLVLDLQVPTLPPDPTSSQVARAVWNSVDNLEAYAISFAVIAVYWLVHRRMFNRITRVDGVVLWLNFLFLFFVVFIPYPTSILADYNATAFGVAFYASIQALVGLTSSAIWLYATRGHRLVRPTLPDDIIRSALLYGLVAPCVFLLSIPIAFVDPRLGQYTWFGIWFAGIGLRLVLGRTKSGEPTTVPGDRPKVRT